MFLTLSLLPLPLLLLLLRQAEAVGAAGADALKSGSSHVAAAAAAGIAQLAQTAPQVATQLVEGGLKPAAADVARVLPALAEGVGAQLLEGEGEWLAGL
jgi:hypothetical protein